MNTKISHIFGLSIAGPIFILILNKDGNFINQKVLKRSVNAIRMWGELWAILRLCSRQIRYLYFGGPEFLKNPPGVGCCTIKNLEVLFFEQALVKYLPNPANALQGQAH